jgi:hypothetical protein
MSDLSSSRVRCEAGSLPFCWARQSPFADSHPKGARRQIPSKLRTPPCFLSRRRLQDGLRCAVAAVLDRLILGLCAPHKRSFLPFNVKQVAITRLRAPRVRCCDNESAIVGLRRLAVSLGNEPPNQRILERPCEQCDRVRHFIGADDNVVARSKAA